jgi:Conserved hypothetical protein (DUF2461)
MWNGLILSIGCGLWMPEAAPLSLVRADIDRNPHAIKRILLEPGIRKNVLGCLSNDEKKAVKAFVSQNGENALKTKPKVRFHLLLCQSLLKPFPFHHVLFKVVAFCNMRSVTRVRSCDGLESFVMAASELALIVRP